MTELGKRLKEKRTENGITIEELQKITKIQKRYLEAIEEGNYDILPGKFYVRAFIKQYAEAVDLDPEMLFDEYEQDIPTTETEKIPERIPRAQKQKTIVDHKNSALISLLPKLLVLILVIGIAVAIYIFLLSGNEDDEQKPIEENQQSQEATVESDFGKNQINEEQGKNDQSNDPQKNVKNNESESEVTSNGKGQTTENQEVTKQKLVKVGEKGSNSTPYLAYQLKGADEFKVHFAAYKNQRSYIGIENGKGKSFFAEEIRNIEGNSSYKKEVSFDFTAEQQVEFNIGNTQGVQMKINDQIFTFPYKTPHQKIKILFSKENE